MSLVRDISGNEYYIGPSGTLNFLNQLRKLVNTNQSTTALPSPDGAAKFALDNTAQALEADPQSEETRIEPTGEAANAAPQDGPSPASITSAIAREFTHLPTCDIDEILRQLPADETLDLLIHSYFKNVHDDFPLFHRATFEDEYELYIVRARRRSQKQQNPQQQLAEVARQRTPVPDWGWVGCLHMMIVFGSIANRHIPNIDHADLRRQSVAAARALLPQFVARCSLTNARVLMLLALFLHNNNERNAAWNLTGTATRICFAMGLHRSDTISSFRPLEREVRKRVFCTLYSFEQFLASSLGRPSGMQEIDVEVVPPREGFLDGGSGTDGNLVSLSLKLQGILARTRLVRVGDSITETGGGRSAVNGGMSSSAPTVDEILEALNGWKEEISKVPGFDLPWIKFQGRSPQGSLAGEADLHAMELEQLKRSLSWQTRTQLRAVLLLHVQFQYIAIVATRSTLLRDIAAGRKATGVSSSRQRMSHHAELCVKHACQLGYIIILLDSFDIINGLCGLDIFYAYCAAMVLILRLFGVPHSGVSSQEMSGLDQQCHQQEQQQEERPRRVGEEEELQSYIRGLVGQVQDVINRADKCGSMKRFARVVNTFAECIDQPEGSPASVNQGPQGNNHQTSSQQWQSHLPGGGNGLPLGHFYGGLDLAAQHPEQSVGSAIGIPQFGAGNFPIVDPMGIFPLSTFDGGQMTHVLGSEDAPMLEWADMEMLLASYGARS